MNNKHKETKQERGVEMDLARYYDGTVILIDNSDQKVILATDSVSLMKSLNNVCAKRKDIYLSGVSEYGNTYKFPKSWIKLHVPTQPPIEIGENKKINNIPREGPIKDE